jgi:hypothetical protein
MRIRRHRKCGRAAESERLFAEIDEFLSLCSTSPANISPSVTSASHDNGPLGEGDLEGSDLSPSAGRFGALQVLALLPSNIPAYQCR